MVAPLSINTFSSVLGGIRDICGKVKTLTDKKIQTLILVDSPIFYSAIRSGLQYQQILFNDATADCECKIDKFWQTILNDWIHWQVVRDIDSFSKFINDLNILNLISDTQASDLNKCLVKFSGNYLINKYDIVYHQLPRELKATIKPFDFGTEDVDIQTFLKKYGQIWAQIGNDHISAVKNLFTPYNQEVKFPLKILLTNLAYFVSNTEDNGCNCQNSLVTILSVASEPNSHFLTPKTNNSDQIFYIWSKKIIDIRDKKVLRYLAKKKVLTIFCLQNELDACLNQLADVVDIHPTIANIQSPVRIYPEDSVNVLQTKIAYNSRHDADKAFDQYSYMLDLQSDTAYPCKMVEILLKNPKNVFYKNVLIPETFSEFSIKKLKKIFIGTAVHDLLNISPNRCCELPEIEEFNNIIAQRFNSLFSKRKNIFGENFNHHVQESLYSSQFVAHKLAKQIVSYGHRYITTELVLSQNLKINFGQKFIKLNGRIDCILSDEIFSIDQPDKDATINIFDFKTGVYESLVPDKLPKQLEDYVGVQILLYGLILRELGFNNINLQVLCPDKRIMKPVSLSEVMSQCEWLFTKLGIIFDTGILGENIHTFADRAPGDIDSDLPISESSVDNATITLKKQISFK